ncbi:hypothetical protein AYI70_g2169 [Smittium culicis]|uniref:Uncharacterized protein n=1 Tax=Smittium culicis TaxID=133412 RepID=A0A1R1Y9L1_9FUNG|nr:hypothetical protein AYI70_g2169 [Smittium culicis]
MNYNSPPLKESAPGAGKKAEFVLNGIQIALAQATRPIDYNFYRKIQDNSGLDTSEDTEIMFASTMRALLFDVAATVTQVRLDNLHKGLDLPGKPTHIIESEIKPLMDQEALDTLIAKKPAAKRRRVQLFRNRHGSTSYAQIGVVQTDGQLMGSEHSFNRINNPLHKPNLRIDSAGGGFEIQLFTILKKAWGASTSHRPAQAQPACREAELQDGVPEVHLPNSPQKRIFDVSRPLGCVHVYPGSDNQDPGPSTRGQQNSECCSPTWPPNALKTPVAQGILTVDIEIVDFDSITDEPSHTEPIILEEPAEIIELSLVLARDPGIGDLHGLQRFSVGNCGRQLNILRIMDTIREDAHKRQGTDDGLVCTQAKECDRTGGVSLLGQHNHTIVRKEIRRNDFPRTARNSRENLVTLLEDQYSSSNDLCPINIAPVLDTFKEWGPTSDLTVKRLTAKLCWLISVTGFLRPSDIHRIDEERSHVTQGVLHLVIVAPKEKRAGRPIEKPCQIAPHTDPILCPVLAYSVYKEKVANTLCPTPHTNNSKWVVNRLLRFVNNKEKPLSVDSVSRYIRSISDLIRRGPDTPIPKGRVIGETLAAKSGVSADEIVSHAFWSNYAIFDTYYRFTRNSSNNLTESIL